MKRKIGIVLMVLGVLLILGAAALLLWNEAESDHAAEASAALMPKLSAIIRENAAKDPQETEQSGGGIPVITEPVNKDMTAVEIDGHSYIGYIVIPKLNLELPVMSEWNYENLKIAPCRYTGTTFDEDLVLVAHNYKKHFGPIRRLKAGDQVYFVDMENVTTAYEVVAVDAVAPTAVEEVTAGAYDLALVTCTYGGNTRLVVYCDVCEP